MKRYECNFLYQYSEDAAVALLANALKILGFEPKYMTIFFDEFERSLNDITFDEENLFKLLKKNPGTITIKSQLYDEDKRDTNNWFRFGLSVNSPFGLDTCSLEWSNVDLDPLLRSDMFSGFLNFRNLIYCYCYDQYDCVNQSNDRIESFIENYPNQPYNVVKNSMDIDVIDISEHWGKCISTRGVIFMAAPLMWFGAEYFKITSKEELLKFKGASLINYSSFDLVHIKLFELYDEPSKIENRERQKAFWNTFDLQNKALQYEKERPFDFIKWYREKSASKKK
jgi:hypothetical protein